MNKSDFFYDLPENLIAQFPLLNRQGSRLMTLNKNTNEISHKHFYDIVSEIQPNDCLILNNTKVLPARIYGVREDTGATVEFLLLNEKSKNVWETLAGPGKKAKTGHKFSFSNVMSGVITEVLENGNRLIEFSFEGNFYDLLDKIGQMPLPHYIKEELGDRSRYQTVYAKELGSAAAPTAGFHFTEELLSELVTKGVKIAYVTLHVGIGTFRPVKEEIIENHKMHSEHYFMPRETADIINETKANGGRVICVGTTSCRTVESVASLGEIKEAEGYTDIFIYPGYQFKCLDALITNYHLPESTLIMLVSAFAGYKNTMNAYKIAVEEKYRFFSFGDCMFIY